MVSTTENPNTKDGYQSNFLKGFDLHSEEIKNKIAFYSPRASLVAQIAKNLPTKQETQVQFLGWEDPLVKSNVYPLQYSCLENLVDKGAEVHGVSKSQTETEWLTLSLFTLYSPNWGIFFFWWNNIKCRETDVPCSPPPKYSFFSILHSCLPNIKYTLNKYLLSESIGVANKYPFTKGVVDNRYSIA